MNSIKEYIELIEKAVKASVPETKGHLAGISDMLFYSLESGGKRIRPLLCLEFASCCGGEAEKVRLQLVGDGAHHNGVNIGNKHQRAKRGECGAEYA